MFFNNIKKNNRNKAQAMLEFILVFPLFLLLLFAILEFSLLGAAYSNVNYSAFAAARAGLVGYDQAKAKQAAVMTLVSQSPHTVSNFAVTDTGFSLIDDSTDKVGKYFLDLLNTVTLGYGGRALYAYALTDVELNDEDNYVQATVTYYYFLKFPIVNRLARLTAQRSGRNIASADVFSDESKRGQSWVYKNKALEEAPYGFVKIIRSASLAKRGV